MNSRTPRARPRSPRLWCLPFLLGLTQCGTSDSGSPPATQPDGAGGGTASDSAAVQPDGGGGGGTAPDSAAVQSDGGGPTASDSAADQPDGGGGGGPGDATGADDQTAQDAAVNVHGDGAAIDGSAVGPGADAAVCQSGADCRHGQLCVLRISCSGASCPPPPAACADDPCDGGATRTCSALCLDLCSGFAVCSLTPDAGSLSCINVPGGA